MPIELTVLGVASRQKHRLLPGESVVLGRAGAIKLDNDCLVSRMHASIEFRNGRVFVTDLGSRNGTTLSGLSLPAHQPFEVREGDEIEISHYRLSIKCLAAEAVDPDKTQAISLLPPAEFQLLEEIGSGGMGSVWKARHRLLGVYRAIKLLKEDFTTDPEDRQRFLREVNIAAAIVCPNIVTVHDARLLHGRVYLIMEYVDGPSLQHLRQQGPMTATRIIAIARGVSVALRELLTHGILHRDVKPGNILLDSAGVARLTDFGIARPFISAATIDQPHGEGLGSIAFVAPEQAIDAETVDQRADIYGLGATLYYLITGLPPRRVRGRTIEQILGLLDEEPPSLQEVAVDCPVKLCELVMRMLARNREDRPHGPSEVIAALDDMTSEYQRHANRSLSDRTYP